MRFILILLAILAFSPVCQARTVIYPTCSWDKPGVDPYMGDIPHAIDDYDDIPKTIRDTLKKRMLERKYDEIVAIRRDSIVGKVEYEPEITDMHFGISTRPKMCRTVSRSKWKDSEYQRGLVYCEQQYCILIPTICRNVSRIKLKPLPKVVPVVPDTPYGPGFVYEIPLPPVTSTPIPAPDMRAWPSPYYWPSQEIPPTWARPPAEVDEPSSLWLFMLGFMVIAIHAVVSKQRLTKTHTK